MIDKIFTQLLISELVHVYNIIHEQYSMNSTGQQHIAHT